MPMVAAQVMNSAASQKEMVGAAVRRYVMSAIKKRDRAVILLIVFDVMNSPVFPDVYTF